MRLRLGRGLAALLAFALLGTMGSERAEAFCGFYVSGGGASLYNNATQVVLMRDGMRTILSMQNNYQGPLEDFAMVIPVPIILQQENVKTLDKALFDKIDQLSAPRLVEYWEQDPCTPYRSDFNNGGSPVDDGDPGSVNNSNNSGVVVEAEFKVGEYEIAILSAEDAGGLERWLDTNNYNIPDGAAPFLAPYVESGSYFFVARIIASEVRYENGQAILSPLRFHYDTATFNLPIRLGLINAQDEQDLLVYILGENQRYNVANYPNVTIPTNINVQNEVRDNFGGFYNQLFERTLSVNPGAIVTEYSWDASTCDPCPGPTLDGSDFLTLGADTLGLGNEPAWRDWTLTRLHARYGRENLGEDLVFQAAPGIVGGREFVIDAQGNLEEGSQPSGINNFQGRYAIRHLWDGEIACEEPVRGVWGGPPGDPFGQPGVDPALSPNTEGASEGSGSNNNSGDQGPLEDLVAEAVPELNVVPSGNGGGGNNGGGGGNNGGGLPTNPNPEGAGDEVDSGCSAASVGGGAGLGGGLFVLGLLALRRARRRS